MFLLLFFLVNWVCYTQSLQCVDQNKQPVDWYVLYKLPQEAHSNDLIKDGTAFTYITSNDIGGWKLSNLPINDSSSILGLTLDPLFSKRNDILYLLYNDENPDGSISFHKGHTKGTVLGDANGGIWLVHSVPRFPPIDSNKYFYPHNGLVYGQSFLCISLNVDNLDSVGTQLKYNVPNIFSKNIPDNFKWMYPKLTDAANNVVNTQSPWNNLLYMVSLGGTKFMSFAKGPKFAKELYLDWVAPTLGVNLFVETWPNGPGRIPSECDIHYKVNNVKMVNISEANLAFKDTNDHSKWAVVARDKPDAKWACIGDINRSTAQRQRGGGTVCFSIGKIATAYQKSVAEVEPCDNINQ
ncbi:hypothetical protein RN001_002365 [Aquatica leii]|uniref:Plancitoxin-1 n=1 Tax=Aquatica leii TaxID=1421715 RepID=A0AAN7SLT0_9COLE|nr:hypothetical protein RN001_002365 [Aquatica leii]